MALNLNGDDITDAVGGGGTSPSDPIQDSKILTLENKTQNINSVTTDGTKTTFDNKVVAAEMDTPLSTAGTFRSSQYFDSTGNSGFFMVAGPTGSIQMNKTTYQGTADGIITVSSNGTIQKTGSTCDASGNLTSIKFRSSQYYDSTGNSGFFMGVGATGTIQMNKTTYQGTADGILTVSSNGTIQKTGSTCDASGNLTAIKFRSSQYYDSTGNSGFFMGVGATGSIQINKTTYQGTDGAIMKLSANGTIEKSGVVIDATNNILPNGNTINIGENNATNRINEVNAQILLANQEVRSNKHYNEAGSAGLDIGTGSVGAINLTGTKYQGKNNQIVTLNGSGQIQQPSANALIDGNGNATFKNLDLLNIASSGEIKAKILQSNDAANTLSLLNRATIAGKGIIIDATTNGNIQFTGDSYINDPNRFVRLNTNGTIEKTPIICDGPTNNNISGINTISATTSITSNVVNSGTIFSPNYALGTFGGGQASAGVMNINSGNITNTGDISPVTDNTEDIGTLALSYKDIHIKGDVYKNGVIYGGGGGGVNGISSVDNGAGDIEISFTGTDYLQNGYLTVDTSGRIQVQPSIQLSNAEYDAIVAKWNVERNNQNEALIKIYLPAGVTPGTFDHTQHFCYILAKSGSGGAKYEVRFIGYQGSTSTVQTSLSNAQVANCLEIYNLTSAAHPNQVPDPVERDHIIDHFISDYQYDTSTTVTSISQVAVQSGDVGTWDHTKPFWIDFVTTSGIQRVITLYGSQGGFTQTSIGSLPTGYTLI